VEGAVVERWVRPRYVWSQEGGRPTSFEWQYEVVLPARGRIWRFFDSELENMERP
jgi:hypothetical protein